MKNWKKGTLVTSYSKTDNRIFRIVDKIPMTSYKDGTWYLMEHVLGEQNENTQYRCIMRYKNFRKLSQEEFNKIDQKEMNTEFKEFKGDFKKGSLVKGVDRSYTRSIYEVVNYYPIPELGIVGMVVKGKEFDGKKINYDFEFIHLDSFELYSPTEEELKIIK